MALVYQNELGMDTLVDMPGDKKIDQAEDPRASHTSDFTFQKEDHTIANLLRMKLHKNRLVRFAGYKVAHPTKHEVIFKVQTAAIHGDEAIPTAAEALAQALAECQADLDHFDAAFDAAMDKFTA
jgi:DNA-directed RNA polymerase II subunit RPB11